MSTVFMSTVDTIVHWRNLPTYTYTYTYMYIHGHAFVHEHSQKGLVTYIIVIMEYSSIRVRILL